YTSGTTGRPKGALHSHRNVVALLGVQFFHGARLMKLRERAERTAATPGDTDFAPLPPKESEPAPQHCRLVSNPLFHVSGLHASLIAHLAGGVKSVWTTGRFSAEKVLAAMQAEKVNGWGPQGSMAYRVLQCPTREEYDVSSVTSIGCGGAPVTPEIQAALREAFPNAVQGLAVGYGQTECTALATMNYGGELLEFPESVGQPLPTVSIEIRDPQGNPLPEGEEGDIFIRSPLVMLGYWKDPEATAKAIHPGRWLQTGDFGRLEAGRLYIHTRKRDLILRAAENVYPAEIERRLDAHPDVAESAVFGVDHPELGQSVKAVVVTKPGKTLDIEALKAWAAEALAYYKVPEDWELRDEPLPRNASGKIMKYLLQDVAESAADLDAKRG
ncbi:MAG: long-chain fatty acid--CoA ligase, partial [Myxococcales bacterium]|nr:long-chain fatty acid--CoA ligase [Myxococcales bacterium]